jgi:hypothetical protein
VAERAAPSGRVVGVDIAAAMLQPARQRIAAAGVDNVELNFAPYAGQQGVVMDATGVARDRTSLTLPVTLPSGSKVNVAQVKLSLWHPSDSSSDMTQLASS